MDNIPAHGDSQDGLLLKVLLAKALFTVGAVGRAAGRGAVFMSRGIFTWALARVRTAYCMTTGMAAFGNTALPEVG